MKLLKYPRTKHIQASKLAPNDAKDKVVAFDSIKGVSFVVEEKVDGSNVGISFDDNGRLLLQSRGHYLTGGKRERQYELLKRWANNISYLLRDVLSNRFIMYGEWMFAKHTIHYTQLPHFFLEFDLFDKHDGFFLDTNRRHDLLSGLPIESVPVLSKEKAFASLSELTDLIGQSSFCDETMEGLYIKHENNGRVVARYKFVREAFKQTLIESSHWLQSAIVPNELCAQSEFWHYL